MGAEQLLKIEPEHELKFKGPFTGTTTSFLKLHNPTDRKICFKIKTTAPKRYCVRPNAGVIESGSNLSIAVVLQPFEMDSSANKHKFMVQAIFAPDGEVNQDELWKAAPSSSVMETKLRCTFEVPSEATNEHEVSSSPEDKVRIKHERDYETTTKPARQSNNQPTEEHNGDDRQLKLELMQLKEENDRLKRKLKARLESGEVMQSAISPPSQSMLFLVMAIIMLMVGLLAGKFAL